ncbi:hypothetical protein WEI85_48485 [Actinomycetes bacterium KLBMP 9797]
MGALFRFLKTRGWSRAALAAATGLTETRVRAVAQGKQQITSYDVLERIASGLKIERGLLGLAYIKPTPDNDPTARVVNPAVATPTLPILRRLADGPVPTAGCDVSNDPDHVAAVQSFRAADRQVGGGHLYATVVKYLHTEVASHLFSGEQEDDSQQSFTAAAALTEMVGWMAHDAGRDGAAERHFARSLDLASLSGEHHLGVQVLASLSHLANHLNRPHEAIRYAKRGGDALASGPKHPQLQARLLAMQARGFAALQQPAQAVQLLHRAEAALTATPDAEPSPWISPFDEGSLASEAARCLQRLGDLHEAQQQADRIIILRRADRARSRALGQLILVTLLVAQGKPDEACVVAQEALNITQQLGSRLVGQQLLDLQPLLAPYRGTAVVDDFLSRLSETLRARIWLYDWFAGGRGRWPAGQEGA